MSLKLDNILITGRLYEEYIAFFDLDIKKLRGKKVLDCPSGASSFVSAASKNGMDAKGTDVLYEFDIQDIQKQGEISIDKIYEDVSWMDGFNFDFYKSIENHKKFREKALFEFSKDYNKEQYFHNTLPKLDFEDKSFDLVLSSHLLFVYDDRFDYEFHKSSILEMLRVSDEVRIFPLVDFNNSHVDEDKNFSPYVYKILQDLKKYDCEIIKVDFEFQPKANYMMVLKNKLNKINS